LLDNILNDPVVTDDEYRQGLSHSLRGDAPSAIMTFRICNLPSVEQERCQALVDHCRL